MQTNRLEAFSDGVMAIIITIMVLNIPLPTKISSESITELAFAIAVFFVSFIVVGSQWVKHHWLFHQCTQVSQKVIWRNILYLFFLSLLPLFTKWIMENPKEVVPAISYDIVFIAVSISFHVIHNAVLKESDESSELYKLSKIRKTQRPWLFFLLIILGTIAIFVLSFYNPTISIIFFVALPVVSTLINLWREKPYGTIRQHEKRRRKKA